MRQLQMFSVGSLVMVFGAFLLDSFRSAGESTEKHYASRSVRADASAKASLSQDAVSIFMECVRPRSRDGSSDEVFQYSGARNLEAVASWVKLQAVEADIERAPLTKLTAGDLPALALSRATQDFVVILSHDEVTAEYCVSSIAGRIHWVTELDLGRQISDEVIRCPKYQSSGKDDAEFLWFPGELVDIGGGAIGQKQRVNVSAVIFNQSHSREIAINSVFTSCGCVEVTEFPKTIRPRTAGRITLRVSASSGTAAELKQEIGFVCADGSRKECKVIGSVPSGVGIAPWSIVLDDLGNRPVDVETEVYCESPADVRVVPVFIKPGLAFVGTEIHPSSRSVRIKWRVDPAEVEYDKNFAFCASAVLRVIYPGAAGVQQRKNLAFVVSGKRPPKIDAHPTSLFCGRLPPTGIWHGKVLVSQRESKVLRLEVDDERYVRADVLSDGLVEVSVEAPPSEGGFSFNLVAIGDEGHAVSIPIVGYVVRDGERTSP